jgi:hypothetical protein
VSSQAELVDYLKGHLHYELLMLRHCLSRCRGAQVQYDYNAFYESWAIHARNLYNFLCNEDGTNRQAREYVPTFRASKTDLTIAIAIRLRSQVLHLAKTRPNQPPKKMSLSRMEEFSNWVESNFAAFLGALEKPFSSSWSDPDPRQPTILLANHTLTASSADPIIITGWSPPNEHK